MKTKRILIAILALLLLFTAGCKKVDEKPDSSVPGYYAQDQTLQGGSEQKGASLASIDVARRQEDVLLTLYFSKDNEQLKNVPVYSVEALTAPSRLVVRLPGLAADFLGQDVSGMGEFSGLIPVVDDAAVTLYFQFEGSVAYKVKQEDGTLVLQVRADDADVVEQNHVKMTHNEQNIAIARENNMSPALCEDGINEYYVSPGFAVLEEADALCQSINTALEASGSDDTAEVVQFDSDKAPIFNEPVSRSMLTMMGALKTQQGVTDGTLVAMDARFLCWADESAMIMARPQTEISGDGESETYEEIWIYHLNGKREQLMDTPFSSVQKAAYSKDGRYIALLEQSDGTRLLYLYDSQNAGLLFLSSEGLGDYTADFAWGNNGVLYAMCGDDSMQLMAYSTQLAQRGEEAISAVEEREGGHGNVDTAGSKVYFNDEYGNIYTVDVDTGERELFDNGDGFLLSPDGSKMVLILYEDGENESQATLILCDLITGTKLQIAAQVELSDYVWSGDSKVLLYLASNKDAADASDYPVQLMRYNTADGKTTNLGVLASNSIFQGRTQDGLIVMFYQNRDNVFYPITYKLNLTEFTNHKDDELIVTIDEGE